MSAPGFASPPVPNYKTDQFVTQPIERVFAFFCDPANLLLVTPPSLNARIEAERLILPSHSTPAVSQCAATGSTFTLTMNVLPYVPVRIQWMARIVQWEQNRFFCDTQVNGKIFRHWYHCHRFRAEQRPSGMGTLITDDVDFETGKGALVNAVVAAAIKQNFTYRRRAVQEYFAQQPA